MAGVQGEVMATIPYCPSPKKRREPKGGLLVQGLVAPVTGKNGPLRFVAESSV